MMMTSADCLLLNFLGVVKNGKKLSIGVSYLKLCLVGEVHSFRSELSGVLFSIAFSAISSIVSATGC